MLYGPFLSLPSSAWRAAITLNLSPEAAELTYLIEVVAGVRLAATRLEARDEAAFTVELHFTIDDTVEQPVEIRVWSEKTAFDGWLNLGRVIVTPSG